VSAAELVIVGAGPAGVSAALWAKSLHLEPVLLESGDGPGGQLLHVYFEPREIAGSLPGDGPTLASAYRAQLAKGGVTVRYGVEVAALERASAPVLTLRGGERLEARALLVATGARRRRLEVPGERALEGRGVSFSATHDRATLAGRTVVVVGGGDAAAENALILAAAGCTVTIAVRDRLRARAEFRERVARESRVRVLERTRVVAVCGEDRVTGVRLADGNGERYVACEGVVVKVGVVPNTEWCRGALPHDDAGYLRVDDSLASPAPGVWAAGDVVRPLLMGVSVALGHGALAAAAIRRALRGA